MEPNFLGCVGFELVGFVSRIIRPDPTFLHRKPVLRFRFSGFALSLWCGSGSDISIWCRSRSCSSSNWCESATTGQQTIHSSVLNLCASIVKVHGPFWTSIGSEIRFRCGSRTDFSLWLRIWISCDADLDPTPWNDADSDLQHRRKLATSYMINQSRCRLHL